MITNERRWLVEAEQWWAASNTKKFSKIYLVKWQCNGCLNRYLRQFLLQIFHSLSFLCSFSKWIHIHNQMFVWGEKLGFIVQWNFLFFSFSHSNSCMHIVCIILVENYKKIFLVRKLRSLKKRWERAWDFRPPPSVETFVWFWPSYVGFCPKS